MFKLVLEKAEEPETKLPTFAGSSKKQESSRKTTISALLTMPKPLTVWITINWKILKEMGIPDHLICFLRNLYAGQFSSVQFSRSVVSDSLWPHELQHTRPPCPSPTPGVYSNSCPSSWGDAIQPSHPLSSPSPPPPNPSQHQSLFQWVNSSHKVAKVLEF